MRGGDRVPCELCRERDEKDRLNSLPWWARESRVPPMTLLVAYRTGRKVLFWGDGQGLVQTLSDPYTAPGPLENVCKVLPCGRSNGLMWGFAGSNKIGLTLDHQLKDFDPSNWMDAKDTLETMICGIVRTRRQKIKDSGADPDHSGLETYFLFAGSIGTETKVLRVGKDGLGEWDQGDPSLSVEGLGANTFRILWAVNEALHADDPIDQPEFFAKVCETFVRQCDGLHNGGSLWVHSAGSWSEHE